MKTPPSIDKLRLSVMDFQLENEVASSFQIQPYSFTLQEQAQQQQAGIFLFELPNGQRAIGKKAFHNSTKGFTADLQLTPRNELMLSVHLNPNKLLHEWKGNTDPELWQSSIKAVKDELQQIGISCNLGAGRLTRLDLAKDKQLSSPIQAYSSVMARSGAKYATTKSIEDTWIIGNKSNQLSLYDKRAEYNSRPKIPAKLGAAYANLTRMETRFLKSETVVKNAGFETFQQLEADIARGGFAELNPIYAEYVKRTFQSYQQLELPLDSQADLLRYYKQHYSRYMEKWEQHLTIEAKLALFKSPIAYRDFLIGVGLHQTLADYHKRKFIKAIEESMRIRQQAKAQPQSIESLYDELMSYAA